MQGNVRESQRGSHTVHSHGNKLAKTHIHDWVILLILLGLVIGLGVMTPFYRYVGKDMMSDLKYPHKSSTVPFWAVPVVAVLLPIVIFVAFYFQRRDVYDLHHAVLGILFSVLITGVLTNAIKDAVGRPRPDFFWRCFPDGKELYDQVTGKVICYGEKSLMNAGHKSFPSGHTSCTVAATFCYLQFFPPPHDINGWGPHAYFHMLESIGGANLPSPGDQQAEEGNRAGSPGVRHNGTNSGDRNNAGSSGVRHNGRNVDDLESARMQYR